MHLTIPRGNILAFVDRDPYEAVLARLRSLGCTYRFRSQDSARAICPGHRDAKPSLVITRKSDRVLMRCFAGCRTSEVLGALGLVYADLFTVPGIRQKPEVVAAYPYTDVDGTVLAEKVRFEPKAFRWRIVDGDQHRWGLDGRAIPLFCAPSLVRAREVLIVE